MRGLGGQCTSQWVSALMGILGGHEACLVQSAWPALFGKTAVKRGDVETQIGVED